VISKASVGILGVGRMGLAIAERLAKHHRLLLADRNAQRLRLAADRTGALTCAHPRQFGAADLVLVLVPANWAVRAVQTCARHLRPDAVLVNMVTALDTATLRASTGRRDVHFVAAKIVGQADALRLGVESVFIVSGDDAPSYNRVVDVLRPLGRILPGDEVLVRRINELATRAALNCIFQLHRQLRGIGAHRAVIKAAIKSVVIGTLLEYPPAPANPYILKLVRRLGRLREHRRVSRYLCDSGQALPRLCAARVS